MSEKPRKPRTARRKPSSVKLPETAKLVVAAEKALVDSDDVFHSTEAQRVARGRLWAELREDPNLRVEQLNSTMLASICRDHRVIGWLNKSKGFRDWLTSPRETEARVEAAYAQLVEGITLRIQSMSDKDYINCLKLVAELANKMPKKWENTRVLDADVGKMSDTAQTQLLIDTLKRMGYEVTKAAAPDDSNAGLLDSADEATQPGPTLDEADAAAANSTQFDPEE